MLHAVKIDPTDSVSSDEGAAHRELERWIYRHGSSAVGAAYGRMNPVSYTHLDVYKRQTRETDLQAVIEMARAPQPKALEDIKFTHLSTAFLLSELKTAFQIGFVIFLPFLLIDLVVSAILMSLGMIMLPPTVVSLPLKILLFILIDGWVLISRLSLIHI